VMPCRRWSEGRLDVQDAVLDDPDLLPHRLAGTPLRRHDPKPPPPPMKDDVAPAQVPAPWWRRVLAWLRGAGDR